MKYLIELLQIDARLAVAFGNDIQYLVHEKDIHTAGLALHISYIWASSLHSYHAGIYDLPFVYYF